MDSLTAYQQLMFLLQERCQLLTEIVSTTKDRLLYAPEGSLHVSRCGKHFQYYCRHSSSDKTGTYIRKDNTRLVFDLAQKEYDQKVQISASDELTFWNSLLKHIPRIWEQVFSSMPENKQMFITPDRLSDDAFVAHWTSVPYVPRSFSETQFPFYSNKNEHMRSKSEVLIANLLIDLGIPYRYEYPLVLCDQRTVYPDFTILNVRTREVIIWEHQGRMGDAGYCKTALPKIGSYIKSGFIPGKNLIITQESSDAPFDLSIARILIQEFLI